MKEYTLKQTDYKIRYHDLTGAKPVIIFLHGLGCASSFDYPEVASMPDLNTHRRILIDLLGAGYSDKPNDFNYTITNHANYLFDFIKDLDLKHIILVGHSLGGSVAIELASLCEERISQLILTEANLDSGGGVTTKAIAAYRQSEFATHGFDEIIATNQQNDNEMWAASFSLWLPQAAYQVSTSAVEGHEPSWRELLYGLSCDKTFIFGEENSDDPDYTVLKEHRIRTGIVSNAGHSMAWQNPEGLAKAIKKAILY